MKKIAILGSGESGIGAAKLALKQGIEFMLSDRGQIAVSEKAWLESVGAAFEDGGHTRVLSSEFDTVVKSPGIPDEAPVVQYFMQQGIPVISEIEFASRFYDGKIIAITGSNGKSTVTGLMYHVLQVAGWDVMVGGNYGISFASILAESNPEWVVLEVSSFQLDNVSSFRPYIAMILNISPDHLDRYGYDLQRYIDAKCHLGHFQTPTDYLLVNGDDEPLTTALNRHTLLAKRIDINQSQYIQGIFPSGSAEPYQLSLKGRHNQLNSCFVIQAAEILGISTVAIQKALLSFKNLPHRLETVWSGEGRTYINDSKATNVDAVYYALEAMEGPVIWIAGGTDKGNDYSVLYPLTEKVKALICLGIDNSKLVKSFEGKIKTICETTKVLNAVSLAKEMAVSGDTILLSPACASFDLFKNYMDRGDQFRSAVLEVEGV